MKPICLDSARQRSGNGNLIFFSKISTDVFFHILYLLGIGVEKKTLSCKRTLIAKSYDHRIASLYTLNQNAQAGAVDV